MINAAKDIIKDAMQTGEICALHIDLQKSFHPDYRKHGHLPEAEQEKIKVSVTRAYNNATQFALETQRLNVQNIWVAYASSEADTNDKPYKASEVKFTKPNSAFYIATPQPNDIVLPKKEIGLFSDNQAYNPMDTLPQTIIIDGVYGEACLQQSLIGAFKEAQKRQTPFNAVIAIDATDMDLTMPSTLEWTVKMMLEEEGITFEKGSPYRLSTAKTDEIAKYMTPTAV